MLVVYPTGAEVCTKPPSFEDDLVVNTSAATLARWHTRRIEWAHTIRSTKIRDTGPRQFATALPTWNLRAPSQ